MFICRDYTVYYTNDSTKSIHNWNLVTIGNYPMTTIPKIVLGQTYHFRVRVNPFDLNTVGPISDILSFKLSNRTKACQTITTTEYHTLRAAATSYSSVEVWWNLPYDPHYVNGFMILYGTLESGYWYNKTTEIVQRVELTNLNKLATYIIIVAAVTDNGLIYYPNEVQVNVTPVEVPMEVKVSDITADSIVINWLPPLGLIPKKYKISYEGDKKYIDADSVIQHQSFSKVDIIVDGHLTSYELVDLIPFTVYSINVSVVPADFSYRPSINVKAKTDVGSPGPMGQPIINGLVDGDNIQIFLPKASEENGPISYYYLVVVPEQDEDHDLSKEM
ncbi:hypothetical protein FQR65_LT17956 [Abscondita terminalis]|nr:hypothetical protein FQR65_LT17956 [Abscondita terminalis]